MEVVYKKYTAPTPILEWIKDPDRRPPSVSIIWKVVLQSFDLIGQGLAWKVGNGRNVTIGLDPWSGCGQGHLLQGMFGKL